jgi:hypothetical protein
MKLLLLICCCYWATTTTALVPPAPATDGGPSAVFIRSSIQFSTHAKLLQATQLPVRRDAKGSPITCIAKLSLLVVEDFVSGAKDCGLATHK